MLGRKVSLILVVTFLWILASWPTLLSAQVRTEWVSRYAGFGPIWNNEAHAITADVAGYVYVTGSVEVPGQNDRDYTTIAYDPNGNEVWVARYDGPAHRADDAIAIAVDTKGYVYVTGSSYGQGTSSDYATVKYDADGNELWVARYDGPAHSAEVATAMAVDAYGNVYVTGWSIGDPLYMHNDFATVKYDADGNELWAARYNGPGDSIEVPFAIAVDAEGNVYVTGFSGRATPEGYHQEYNTVKYDPDGNQVWVARYSDARGTFSSSYALALDSEGYVYVTGASQGVGGNSDYATIKYSPEGGRVWVARYSSTGNGEAQSIALDAEGNVYVTGVSQRRRGDLSSADYATVKYDPEGNEVWVARYDGFGGGSDVARALALDSEGNVYVTGGSRGFRNSDYATLKYDPDGNQLWVQRYYHPLVDGEDFARAIAVDQDGNIYVTGRSRGIGRGHEYATIKYSQGK